MVHVNWCNLSEKFTDMNDNIVVVKNGVSNKIFDTDSKLNVLQDDVAEIKDDVLWTKPLSLLRIVREVVVHFVVIFHKVWFQRIWGIHCFQPLGTLSGVVSIKYSLAGLNRFGTGGLLHHLGRVVLLRKFLFNSRNLVNQEMGRG